MKPYSDFAPRRSMQIVADLVALLTLGAVVWAGVALYQLVDGLGAIGRQLEAAGAAFKAAMSDLGTTLGGVPLIGPGIRAPFDGASGAGAALESAGQNQHVAMSQLAAGLGIGAIALPAAVILAVWLIPRIRFGVRAARVQELARTSAGIDLLALRALIGRTPSALRGVDPEPLAAWRRGDDRVLLRLATLELQASGVRLPALSAR